MGKGTDKLYITHSEWASEDAFSASVGSRNSNSKKIAGAAFKRLPFNFCALSLQPFSHPVCTANGAIFDLTNILPWIKKHGTNPVDGTPLKSSDLIKLNYAKNEDDEFMDPVTFKTFTDNTHIVALRNTGNVFSWETIERLNIKAKNWRDLVSEDEFSRKDIITLQDPQNLESRDLSAFKYLLNGESAFTPEQERERNDPTSNLNLAAMGSSAKILKAKEAIAKARAERQLNGNPNLTATNTRLGVAGNNGISNPSKSASSTHSAKQTPYNAAQYTTGKAAASFTSTGVTPHTSNQRAILSDEEYMLKPRRIKEKGYARIQTNLGNLNVELNAEFAPKAVWNFVQLAKKGYYRNIPFHRNIRHFMIQGGDPTGTGRGGQSIWGKPFEDEYAQSPLIHDAKGVLSMANKGKNTNTSQFFITYRATSHLDRKHTVFGKVVDAQVGGDSEPVLKRLENVTTDDEDRPTDKCEIEDIVVFVDPFEEFLKNRAEAEGEEREKAEVERQGGAEDERTTWTGKRIRDDGQVEDAGDNAVGKYLKASKMNRQVDDEIIGDWDEAVPPPPPKKNKTGGFGNFDSW